MQKQNDLKRSDFSSIDIFLFSNGQQHSPPRKYNLRADELNWWESTLNYLARSHYGSKHTTIELYTLDGKKVASPLELSAAGAYVAVEPPDAFLQSGYDKYLMKASRSWEKRQERKGSNGALTERDKDELNKKPEVKHTTTAQNHQDLTIIPTSAVADEREIVKPSSYSKTKTNGRRYGSLKQIQKRIVSSPQQNPSILRKKYVNPVDPIARKKRSVPIGVSNVNTNKQNIDSRNMKTLQKETSLLKFKNPGITQMIERDDAITKKNRLLQDTHEEIQGNQQPSTIIRYDEISGNKQSQNLINKSNSIDVILSSLYSNEEHNHQSIFINPTPKMPAMNHDEKDRPPFDPSCTEPKVLINSVINDLHEKSEQTHHQMHGIEGQLNITPTVDAPGVFDKKLLVAGSQTADNLVIYINHGESHNLTINLEIKNVPGSTSVEVKSLKPSDLQALKSETEPQGQVDVDKDNASLNKCFCDQAMLKSWQPISAQIRKAEDQVQETFNDMKITVCQCNCNCCSKSNKLVHITATPLYFDSNNDVILLPLEKRNGNLLRCSCIFEIQNKNNVSPTIKEDGVLAVSKSIRDSLELLEDKFLNRNPRTLNYDHCSKCTILPTSLLDNDQQATSSSVIRPSTTNIAKDFNNASTQTDWTNLLLEARLHEDGRYSFHMPPLEMLKLYNAL